MRATRYAISVRDLDLHPEVEIDRAEYVEIHQARNIVLAALGVEETFDLLISNYLDFERELLEVTVEHSIRPQLLGFAEFFQVKHRPTRRIVNLLTAARLFVDQLPKRVMRCSPETGIDLVAKAALRREYDSRFGYRFMEALRNHVQHSGLPVESMRIGSARSGVEEAAAYNVDIYANKQILSGTSFKKSVLNEMPDLVDLKEAIRDYMTGLSAVQEEMRRLTAHVVRGACRKVARTYAKYPGPSRNKIGLAAIAFNDAEQVQYVPVNIDWEKTWRSLVRANATTSASARFVTSQLQPVPHDEAPDTVLMAPR